MSIANHVNEQESVISSIQLVKVQTYDVSV